MNNDNKLLKEIAKNHSKHYYLNIIMENTKTGDVIE